MLISLHVKNLALIQETEVNFAEGLNILSGETGEIAGAGLDVLSAEPMRKDNPLRKIKDSERLIITPHIGWASVEARTRLMEIICQQIADFQNQIIL